MSVGYINFFLKYSEMKHNDHFLYFHTSFPLLYRTLMFKWCLIGASNPHIMLQTRWIIRISFHVDVDDFLS